MNILSILNEFNESNSLNHKRMVCKKYKDNATFIEVFTKAYDKVKWTWNISLKNIPKYTTRNEEDIHYALKEIEKLSKREITGNNAIHFLSEILSSLSSEDAKVIEKIINRDLRINFGKREYNKIVDSSNACLAPVYMRCSVFGPKTAKDIAYPAILQLKADGTYREMQVLNGSVEFMSRSGENYEYTFQDQFANLQEGHYTGELLVLGTKDRAESNGLLNSDNPPMDRIVYYVWDYITPEEYSNAAKKIKNTTKYKDRFAKLKQIVAEGGHEQIQVIESHEVNTPQEAFEKVVNWMNEGLEGGVLKDKDGVFRDGTSKHQLKMKLEIELDVRIVGFKEGKIGTKREETFGAIYYETDDGQIKGAVSGFTDEQLEEINNNREKYLQQIISVCCNDLTKGRDNDYYALSHPRFKEVRTDKTETDTLERALEIKQMSMCFT